MRKKIEEFFSTRNQILSLENVHPVLLPNRKNAGGFETVFSFQSFQSELLEPFKFQLRKES